MARETKSSCTKMHGKPPAIVIGLEVTGLGTVRGLADGGVEVVALALSPKNNPGLYSRMCQVIKLFHLEKDPDLLSDWLYDYAKKRGDQPVVFPTSDVYVLMLAKHRDKLSQVCRFWANDFHSLEAIVSKNLLYDLSSAAGVRVPPYIHDFNSDSIDGWCNVNQPPYLLKPFYNGSKSNTLGVKNKHFFSKDELLDYVNSTDTSGLIVMQILKGGDGRIFDCYGLCGLDGKILTVASHLRIRQHSPDFGSTCFGEIPAIPDAVGEDALFRSSEQLLSKLNYHGIFGIEWLQEQTTKELYMIDFNARPFSSIGHLNDSGLNLPIEAYNELCRCNSKELLYAPSLKHVYWLDFNRDAMTFMQTYKHGRINFKEWFGSLLKARSFACWRAKDPGPSIYRLKQLLTSVFSIIFKKLFDFRKEMSSEHS